MSYYLNIYTKESQWDLPTSAAENMSSGPCQVQAAHLLVKHNKSRRPSSWREDNITRSRAEAREILQGYLDQVIQTTFSKKLATLSNYLKIISLKIKSGEATLGELAQKYSDCSSAKRGGDLGMFGRGSMQKPFEEAAFGLKVGQLSDIIETDSGLHIIERIK